MEENELLTRAKEGDRWAFGVLVRMHQPMVFRTVLRMVRNEDDAMDITQDSFVRAFTRLEGFRGASSFGTWVCRIAINQALNLQRARKPVVDAEKVHLSSAPEDVLAVREQEYIHARLDEAIEALPPRQRLTLLLRVKDGKSHKEIADLLDCAVGTSKASFHSAVLNLRKALGDLPGLGASHETP